LLLIFVESSHPVVCSAHIGYRTGYCSTIGVRCAQAGLEERSTDVHILIDYHDTVYLKASSILPVNCDGLFYTKELLDLSILRIDAPEGINIDSC